MWSRRWRSLYAPRQRVGQVVKVALYSMTIVGTLEEWRTWTGLPFDRSGATMVPGALVPVQVLLEQNYAVYVEPNVWVHHRLGWVNQCSDVDKAGEPLVDEW